MRGTALEQEPGLPWHGQQRAQHKARLQRPSRLLGSGPFLCFPVLPAAKEEDQNPSSLSRTSQAGGPVFAPSPPACLPGQTRLTGPRVPLPGHTCADPASCFLGERESEQGTQFQYLLPRDGSDLLTFPRFPSWGSGKRGEPGPANKGAMQMARAGLTGRAPHTLHQNVSVPSAASPGAIK